MRITRYLPFVALLLFAVLLLAPGSAGAQDAGYEGLYDPFDLKSFHLEMSEESWDIVRNDLSFDVYRPALMTVDEETILVGVRRKSAESFPLNDPSNPQKVSLKIDINEYHEDGLCVIPANDDGGNSNPPLSDFEDELGNDPTCVSRWRGVKKLSWENGDDNNVVTEGVSWYLHNLAAEESGLDYTTGRFAWMTLDLTLTDRGDSLPDLNTYNGVFVSVEQRDDAFLENHDLVAASGDTWLYKYSDPYNPEIKEGPGGDSPAFLALNYKPFQECKRGCTQPSDADFVSELNSTINMEGMLTFGAVSAFHLSPDDLFSKGKNFYFVDYSENGLMREYIQWDLDSAFSGFDYTADIYDVGNRKFGAYEDWIIDNSTFNEQYGQKMSVLVNDDYGVFNAGRFNTDLGAFESMLAGAMAADPYVDLANGDFSSLSSWLSNRVQDVQDQISDVTPPPPPPTGPTANFGYTTNLLDVSFSDLSVGNNLVSWSWDFGDGSGTSTLQNPPYLYGAAGTYYVTLTVTESDGDFDSVTKPVTVSATLQPPTAIFDYSASDLSVSFSDESTGDYALVSWAWDFGDGSSSTAQNPDHVYASAATYAVSLTVTDINGNSDTTSQSVTVTDPPVGGATFTATGYKVKGVHHVALSWENFASAVSITNIAGNTSFSASGGSTGNDVDDTIGAKGGWITYTYEACDASTCLNATATAP